MKIRFLCEDQEELREVREILAANGVEILPCVLDIAELQTQDMRRLVSDKLLAAFKLIGKPVFVEHTGLLVRSLNGFPGGLTRIFLDQLLVERFVELIGKLDDPAAEAKTLIGYCDGRRKHFFEGSVAGRIAREAGGDSDLQWERVFIPQGQERPCAELEDEQRLVMRRQALEAFAAFLRER